MFFATVCVRVGVMNCECGMERTDPNIYNRKISVKQMLGIKTRGVRMKLLTIFLGILSLSISFSLNAGNVISNIPAEPDASEKYIFYLHGSAEESEGTTDKYETATEAIAESSATVISEVRGRLIRTLMLKK